jgi:MoaA/NifB/PqqE/SkfB family radical SAM enzyme
MSPGQFEIQLGHLCNDRCVFCVSGALTRRREAPLLPAELLVDRLREAYAAGHRRVTLIGGEPTIQPAFLEVVRAAVTLGFEQIVVFTNGSKASRTDLVDRVLETGGNFEWRLSFQGGSREAHERTTRRRGSFDELARTLAALKARGQRITINGCVVTSNYASFPELPRTLGEHGIAQVHLDMLNPDDTGDLPDAEVRAMQPRYRDLAEPLARTIEAFGAGFDVHIGNLPFCAAPRLAPWIHHGGTATSTVVADDFGAPTLARARDKYLVKTSLRTKPPSCARCVFDDRCAGAFEAYVRWFGEGDLEPVTAARLAELDPEWELLALHARPLLAAALRPEILAPTFARARVDLDDLRRATIHLEGDAPRARLSLRLSRGAGGVAATGRFRVEVASWEGDAGALDASLQRFVAALGEAGESVVHPPGPDAFGELPSAIARPLARLRAAAPFGELRWRAVRAVRDTRDTREAREGHATLRVELDLASPSGESVVVWLGALEGRSRGGYRLESGAPAEPSTALREGIGVLMAALARRSTAAR